MEICFCWLGSQNSKEEWKKKVRHLGLHWSKVSLENCLEFDQLINSCFESLKWKWDFRGCAVCYFTIFMFRSKKENAIPEQTRICLLLIHFCLHCRNETYRSETAYEKVPHTQLILYIAFTWDVITEKKCLIYIHMPLHKMFSHQ